MDPTTFISAAPSEWIPALIIISLAYKLVMFYLNKKMVKSAVSEELNKEPDAEG